MQNEKTMIFEGLKVYDNGWPWNCDVMTSSEAVNERISFAKELIKEYKKYKDLIKLYYSNLPPNLVTITNTENKNLSIDKIKRWEIQISDKILLNQYRTNPLMEGPKKDENI